MDENCKISQKVSGYLEKKGKMKMMSSYKKYWFVLEGRLLLYYRSKDEYDAISPCKGSINLGPPCNVKPCPSAGVFQIETRSGTITLRAENRDDQNRWMQGIISALNQNKSSNKLGHFRYSLNEIPQQELLKEKLKRQNTLPTSIDPPKNHSTKGIIQRLQKIGAQSYGGSIGAINQIANTKKISSSNSNESLQYPEDLVTLRNSLLVENDRYGILKKNSISESIDFRTGRRSTENIYERISLNLTATPNHNTGHYDVPTIKTENIQLQMTKQPPTYDSNLLRKSNNEPEEVDRPTTFLLENEVYCPSKPDGNTENKGRQTSIILENDQYCSVEKRTPNAVSETIYCEPKCTELVDHNENNVELRNGHNFVTGEENAYSIIKLYGSEKDIAKNNSNCEYEDIDKYAEYADLYHQKNESVCKSSLLKKEKKKKHHKNKDDGTKETKLKKNSSFMKKVWKRKNKRKETEENVEELYETVPAAVVEKLSINDDTAIQMLSELHSILEHKKPVLKERLCADSSSKGADEKTEDKTATTNVHCNDGSRTCDETAIQMLTELQNILENKKNILARRACIDKEDEPVKSERNLAKNENETKNANIDVEAASTSSGSEKIRPTIPPKLQHTAVPSPYHDYPKNNQPINKIPPPKKNKRNLENIKSLDEILDDLEKERSGDSTKNKVQELIKQFNESDFDENDVVLRTNRSPISYYRGDSVDSDELNRLLNELVKVTCAPILTPGVTTSLINPHLTDEELQNLIPKRRRRYSEPDYDIPRPHKSLISLPRKETSPDSVIGSTQFFGPILTPSDINIKTNLNTSSDDLPSMTPDSLELDAQIPPCPQLSYLSEEEKTSYNSHNYTKCKTISSCCSRKEGLVTKKNTPSNIESSIKRFDSIIIENDIYAQPKSLHHINEECQNHTHNNLLKSDMHSDVEVDEKLHEVFEDSLETCSNENEISRAF